MIRLARSSPIGPAAITSPTLELQPLRQASTSFKSLPPLHLHQLPYFFSTYILLRVVSYLPFNLTSPSENLIFLYRITNYLSHLPYLTSSKASDTLTSSELTQPSASSPLTLHSNHFRPFLEPRGCISHICGALTPSLRSRLISTVAGRSVEQHKKST